MLPISKQLDFWRENGQGLLYTIFKVTGFLFKNSSVPVLIQQQQKTHRPGVYVKKVHSINLKKQMDNAGFLFGTVHNLVYPDFSKI